MFFPTRSRSLTRTQRQEGVTSPIHHPHTYSVMVTRPCHSQTLKVHPSYLMDNEETSFDVILIRHHLRVTLEKDLKATGKELSRVLLSIYSYFCQDLRTGLFMKGKDTVTCLNGLDEQAFILCLVYTLFTPNRASQRFFMQMRLGHSIKAVYLYLI